MPTRTRVLLELRSADVIHAFWVPQLGRKMDMVCEEVELDSLLIRAGGFQLEG